MIPVQIIKVPRLWPPWVSARVSNRTIYVTERTRLTTKLLAHELCHVIQRERLGAGFLFVYLLGWIEAGFVYKDNPLELEARDAEQDPFYLSWAERILNKEVTYGT